MFTWISSHSQTTNRKIASASARKFEKVNPSDTDFCSGCAYDVKQKTGETACPFNYLYWAFLIRQKNRLSGNPRLAMPYRALAVWPPEREAAVLAEADSFLDRLEEIDDRSSKVGP